MQYNLPAGYRLFQHHRYIAQDGSGSIYLLGLLRAHPEEVPGAVVFRAEGDQLIPILEPGVMAAFGSFTIINGLLHITITDMDNEYVTSLLPVPGAAPMPSGGSVGVPAPATVYVVDEQARVAAREAKGAAEYATGRANSAYEIANRASGALGGLREELRQLVTDMGTQLRTYAADTAWAKANDAIAAQWGRWVRYEDTRLYNVIYNRVLLHMQRLGIKNTDGIKRAEPTE